MGIEDYYDPYGPDDEPVHEEDDGVSLRHFGVLRETEKAICFKTSKGRFVFESQWIPKSVILEQNGEEVVVKTWFADRNDLT